MLDRRTLVVPVVRAGAESLGAGAGSMIGVADRVRRPAGPPSTATAGSPLANFASSRLPESMGWTCSLQDGMSGRWLDVWLSEVKGFDGTRPATMTLYRPSPWRAARVVLGRH
jgi:hypothetical protein